MPATVPSAIEPTIEIVLVLAASRNRVIGRRGGLPWRLPSDLKRFRIVTFGHPCVMGRCTWESIGRPLPGRDMIVVTRSHTLADTLAAPELIIVPTLAAGLERGRERARQRAVGAIMIIGGGQIYRAALPLADRIVYTEVQAEIDGDTTVPALGPEWQQSSAEHHRAGPGDEYDVIVKMFRRGRPA